MQHEDDGLPEKAAGEQLTEQGDRQKEETDFCRAWREPIELLEKENGTRNLLVLGPRRTLPWMQAIKETKYDFSKFEEDEGGKIGGQMQAPLMPPRQAPKKKLNVGASEFVPSPGGFAEDGSGTGAMEGDDDPEVDAERNMEIDTAEDSLPGDLSEEQGLRANSDNGSDNLTLWYTDQVRKWYRHAV